MAYMVPKKYINLKDFLENFIYSPYDNIHKDTKNTEIFPFLYLNFNDRRLEFFMLALC